MLWSSQPKYQTIPVPPTVVRESAAIEALKDRRDTLKSQAETHAYQVRYHTEKCDAAAAELRTIEDAIRTLRGRP